MKNIIILLVIFIIILNTNCITYARNNDTQIVEAEIPNILYIEKILVEGKDYDKDQFLDQVHIKEEIPYDKKNTFLELTPVRVQLRTNVSTPICLNVDFVQMDHVGDPFMLETSDLDVHPKQRIINNPYDHMITDDFTPIVDVKPYALPGLYEGILTFTLGVL